MTWGVERLRRAGLSRRSSWTIAWLQVTSVAALSSGEKSAPWGDGSASDAQCCDEGDPVGVLAHAVRRLPHERADREVAAQMAPDLLFDEIGRLRSQYRARSTLVGLQLVEGGLDLPPLGVGGGEGGGRRRFGIEDRREQAVLLDVVPSVVDRVVDDAQPHRRGVAPLFAPRRPPREP